MIKILITLILLVSSIWGQYNPRLYSQIGNKLFDANIKFELVQYDDSLINKIQAYKIKSKLIQSQGLDLESKQNISFNEKKEYLKSLRKLENYYQNIIGSLEQVLLNTIQDNNYDGFVQLSNIGLNDIFQSSSVNTKVIEFYQINKNKGSIEFLDRLIDQKNLEKESHLT